MIESLAEHGVDPSDLVPALTTTHTVKNPEFDPVAKMKAESEAETVREEAEEEEIVEKIAEAGPSSPARSIRKKVENPFGDDDDEDELPLPSSSVNPVNDDYDEGDLGAIEAPPKDMTTAEEEETTPKAASVELPSAQKSDPTTSTALPGVSTSLSNTDETVTLDIRWTVVCPWLIHASPLTRPAV